MLAKNPIFLLFQQLRHENLVNLIEVFRRKKRLYLVFEFVDHTVLDDLERFPKGLDEHSVRKVLWQVLKGTEFCHLHNVSIYFVFIIFFFVYYNRSNEFSHKYHNKSLNALICCMAGMLFNVKGASNIYMH